jgi:hypothetical protein
MSAADWDANHATTLSKGQWETQVEKLINLADSAQLFADFSRTNSGLHYGQIKREPGQEAYIWKYDRRSTIVKFALRSRSYKLQARTHKIGHGPWILKCVVFAIQAKTRMRSTIC